MRLLRIDSIGVIWSVVVVATLTLYGLASWRAGGTMQHVAAWLLWSAAVVAAVVPFVPWLQTGHVAAIRVAAAVSSLVFRSLVLLVVGSVRADRTGELIGAGTAACFAAAVVLMRLQFEVTLAAASNASTD